VRLRRFSALALLTAALAVPACDRDNDDDEGGPPTGADCPPRSTRCHASSRAGAQRHGAPRGYDFDTVAGVRKHLDDIDRMAAAGPDATNAIMPPNGPRPSVAERRKLGEWLACGAR
jgi:hypothetical protein